MRNRARLTVMVACATALACGVERTPSALTQQPMKLSEAMSPGSIEGFERVLAPREFSFPADHGSHPDFQTEWWYLVGNLDGEGGRRFGYQITFFRSSLQPSAPSDEETSPWATHDIFMGHFAVTDVADGEFHAFERLSRGSLDLAGARTEPFAVWLEDWRLESVGDDRWLPARLRASQDGIEVDLRIDPGKPMVLQGEAGFSRKGALPGNASYYYSMTRLPTGGTVRLGDEEFAVEGESWIDREWSTSALEPGQIGWDWFALQLGDARELMVYRMRLDGDRTDPTSSGVIVEADGSYEPLAVVDFEIEVTRRWTSAETGVEYPVAWRVQSARARVDLAVEALIDDQEHRSTVLYWEGAVEVRGTSASGPVDGRGYVELTGYDGPTSPSSNPDSRAGA